jgi:hypothetical protein
MALDNKTSDKCGGKLVVGSLKLRTRPRKISLKLKRKGNHLLTKN